MIRGLHISFCRDDLGETVREPAAKGVSCRR